MERSPAMASALVLFFVIGVPFALISRLADGLMPLRPMDVPLGIALIGWLLVSRSILSRDELVDSIRLHPSSARFQAHSLVEQSIFGVGFAARDEEEPVSETHRLAQPIVNITELMPEPIATPEPIRPSAPRRSHVAPVMGAAASEDDEEIEILATEEYTVCRGDTWWSIAEATLGDGRHWTAVRDINVGRPVAPDRSLAADDDLRIGWRVLIPLMPSEATDAVDDRA